MLKWVDLAEICISEAVIFQNNWKFDTKLDRMFEKSILKHFVDPSTRLYSLSLLIPTKI